MKAQIYQIVLILRIFIYKFTNFTNLRIMRLPIRKFVKFVDKNSSIV
jgi:hypothetical protein